VVVKEGMKWYLLIVTTLSTYVLLVDPALSPLMVGTIKTDLEISQTASIWFVNSYYIAFASFLLIGGRMCEILGFRNLYKGGAAVYTLGALLCYFSGDFYSLIMGRVVQGIGAGLNLPTIAAMIIASFPKEERGRAIAIDSGVAGVLVLISVFFSGFIIQYLSWHILFLGYAALSVIGIFLSIFIVKPQQISFVKLPILNTLMLISGMVITVAAIMEAGRADWDDPLLISGLVGGPLLLVIFVIQSLRMKEPLADFSLFKNETFFRVNLVRIIVFSCITLSVVWVIYIGSNLKMRPAELGILMFTAQLPALFTSLLGGYLSDKYSYRVSIALGFALVITAFSYVTINYHVEDPWIWLPGMLCFTGAQPILISQSMALGLSIVPKEKLGSMSGLMATIQQFAQALALSLFVAIFVELETRTESTFTAFLGVNLVGVALAVTGFLLTLRAIPNKKL
jgi:MFS family permease